MATYATISDFEEYVEGWTTTDPAALEALLAKAERDIDRLLGPWPARADTGLKFDPATDLTTHEAAALARAVSAQAYHRHQKGATLAESERVASKVSGPDFTIEYTDSGTAASVPSSMYSPLVRGELDALRRFTVTGARARA